MGRDLGGLQPELGRIDGADGFTGLTLHATSKTGRPETSVTFAGKTMADMGSLQISENAQSGYTYITQT